MLFSPDRLSVCLECHRVHEELDENDDVGDAGGEIINQYYHLILYTHPTESILVRVDLDIVKNPAPVIGWSRDNLLISNLSFSLSNFSFVLSSFSSFSLIRFCTESKADSTVRVRATRFKMLLPKTRCDGDIIFLDSYIHLTYCSQVSREQQIFRNSDTFLVYELSNAWEYHHDTQ